MFPSCEMVIFLFLTTIPVPHTSFGLWEKMKYKILLPPPRREQIRHIWGQISECAQNSIYLNSMACYSELSSLCPQSGVDYTWAFSCTGEHRDSDCIAASVKDLVIPIKRPELRGQPFPTRDKTTPFNLARKYTFWLQHVTDLRDRMTGSVWVKWHWTNSTHSWWNCYFCTT